ncbi:hypothetical protein HY091_00740 [Candidatus Kaiserbacteria bacterium]|nr:hypothetical protein [Candidatus Kaiserbacteria bacterium]
MTTLQELIDSRIKYLEKECEATAETTVKDILQDEIICLGIARGVLNPVIVPTDHQYALFINAVAEFAREKERSGLKGHIFLLQVAAAANTFSANAK